LQVGLRLDSVFFCASLVPAALCSLLAIAFPRELSAGCFILRSTAATFFFFNGASLSLLNATYFLERTSCTLSISESCFAWARLHLRPHFFFERFFFFEGHFFLPPIFPNLLRFFFLLFPSFYSSCPSRATFFLDPFAPARPLADFLEFGAFFAPAVRKAAFSVHLENCIDVHFILGLFSLSNSTLSGVTLTQRAVASLFS